MPLLFALLLITAGCAARAGTASGEALKDWIISRIAPTAPTDSDFKNLQFQILNESKESSCKAFFLSGFLPLMEAEKNLHADHLRVKIDRSKDDDVKLSISSKKALKDALFDFKHQTFERTIRGEVEGRVPSEDPPGEKNNGVVIGFGRAYRDREEQCISINLPQQGSRNKLHSEIPYKYGTSENSHTFYSPKFPVCAMAKIDGEPSKLTSILLLDVMRPAILAEIAVPEFARTSSPIYALDVEQQLLVGIGSDLKWLIVIDLKTLIRK